jgi:hypothetical protein
MKKFVVTLFVFVGIFLAGTVFATEWYTVQVTGGEVIANPGGGVTLPTGAPGTPVANLNSGYAPFTTVGNISGLYENMPTNLAGDGWNAAGGWTFEVTGSSGSGWNNVFGGGNYTFTSDWLSTLLGPIHFGELNTTFDAIYGKWSMNNPSVWTYFGLYVPPNTGAAQTGEPPIGIFAFLADDPLLYPNGFSLAGLYGATANGPIALNGQSGTGRFEANSVPEPATMLLLGLGLVGLAGARRKFKK